MLTIKTMKDIRRLKERKRLEESYLNYLQDFFKKLYISLADEESLEDFSLEEHGYFVILEPENKYNGQDEFDSTDAIDGKYGDAGGHAVEMALIKSDPEYIEKDRLEDGTEIYKIAILSNNDYMMFYFSSVGQLGSEFESWVQEHLEMEEFIVNLALQQNRDSPTGKQ